MQMKVLRRNEDAMKHYSWYYKNKKRNPLMCLHFF